MSENIGHSTPLIAWKNLTPQKRKEANQRKFNFAAVIVIILIGLTVAAYYCLKPKALCCKYHARMLATLPIFAGLVALGLLYKVVTTGNEKLHYGEYKKDLTNSTNRQEVEKKLNAGNWKVVFEEFYGTKWLWSGGIDGNGGAAPLVWADLLIPAQGESMNALANKYKSELPQRRDEAVYDRSWNKIIQQANNLT